MVLRLIASRCTRVLSNQTCVLCSRSFSSLLYPLQPKHINPNHDALYEESLNNPERFWGDLAKQRLRWSKEFDTVMDCDMHKGKINWFLGGKLNVSGKLFGHSTESWGALIDLNFVKDFMVVS